MENKSITPKKNFHNYLDILKSSTKKKSIFGASPQHNTSFTHKKISTSLLNENNSTDQINNLSEKGSEQLINEIQGLLEILKLKYKVYTKAQQQNIVLKRENEFLKTQLDNLRVSINHRQLKQAEMNQQKNKIENEKYRQKFRKAKLQLVELKKIYNHNYLNHNFDSICALLQEQ